MPRYAHSSASHSFADVRTSAQSPTPTAAGDRPPTERRDSGQGQPVNGPRKERLNIGERGQFQSGCNAPRRPTKAGRHPRRPRVRGAPSGRTRIRPSALQQDGRDGLDGLMLSRKLVAGSPHRHPRPGIKAPTRRRGGANARARPALWTCELKPAASLERRIVKKTEQVLIFERGCGGLRASKMLAHR